MKKAISLGLVIVFLIASSGISFSAPQAPFQRVYLIENDLTKTKAYQVYLSKKGQQFSEVYYLIHLAKQTRHQFSRDGRKYNGEMASKYLRYILNEKREGFSDVEGFINYVSDRSMKVTGNDFFVHCADGSSHSAKTVLMNEVDRLRLYERVRIAKESAGEMKLAYQHSK